MPGIEALAKNKWLVAGVLALTVYWFCIPRGQVTVTDLQD
jgi:hypothetical protein